MDNDNEYFILLPSFRFPDHWQIQEWLSGTEYGEEFNLVLIEIEMMDRNGEPIDSTRTVPGLSPKTKKGQFHWKLKGENAGKELEQKVLDFKLAKAL